MNRYWLISIILISLFLMTTLRAQKMATLTPFFQSARSIKLQHFEQSKEKLNQEERDLLELWESMITGRSAPVASWMKERYTRLGLSHLFTPSGFHLSAVLSPVFKLVKLQRWQLLILGLFGAFLILVPGQGALKRMVNIKISQRIFHKQLGFGVALLLDLCFGSFQASPLSFTYSFLFLGIIYSGLSGIGLVIWFFLAQVLLAHVNEVQISPLLLLFSPLLNFAFGLAMPLLFALAFPLWNWQLHLGIKLLKLLQGLIDYSAWCTQVLPSWEANVVLLMLLLAFLCGRFRLVIIATALFSAGLNLDVKKEPGSAAHEYRPKGKVLKIKLGEVEDTIYFSDGKCYRRLVRGHWWEKCSPRRRSINKKV